MISNSRFASRPAALDRDEIRAKFEDDLGAIREKQFTSGPEDLALIDAYFDGDLAARMLQRGRQSRARPRVADCVNDCVSTYATIVPLPPRHDLHGTARMRKGLRRTPLAVVIRDGSHFAPGQRTRGLAMNIPALTAAQLRRQNLPVLSAAIAFFALLGAMVYFSSRQDEDMLTSGKPRGEASARASQPEATPPVAVAAAMAAPATAPAAATAPIAAPPEAAAAQPAMNQEPVALARTDMMTVRVSGASLRAEPKRRARVVADAPRGSQVKVVRRSGDWVEVEADGRHGWVSKKVLTREASAQR